MECCSSATLLSGTVATRLTGLVDSSGLPGEASVGTFLQLHPAVYAGVFAIALILALVSTPLAGKAALRLRLLDLPSNRKVHRRPIPRAGGIALYVSFLLPFAACMAYMVGWARWPAASQSYAGFFLGATAAFALGLVDDARGLPPWLKVLGQCTIGMIAFASGFAISALELPVVGSVTLGWLALPVSILWYLLILNAINLIDGLDGLAAGVVFFSCTVLFVLCLLNDQYLAAVGFATAAGATLGFLRYNFNPASIFMGDSGSHFLGFTLASLSIIGSMKRSASVTILIPILAMGLPLMDVVWSAMRRFFFGQSVFHADSDHMHHRLLKLGYTHKRAVLFLYGVTATLGALSLFLVHSSNRQAALILAIVGISAIFLIRRLGYIDYLTSEKTLGWLRDVTSTFGFERRSRTFLGIQVAISQSSTLDELWDNVVVAAEHLRLERIRLEIQSADSAEPFILERFLGDEDRVRPEDQSVPLLDALAHRIPCSRLTRLEMPFGRIAPLGVLLIEQDFARTRMDVHVFRRSERLCRAVEETVERILATDRRAAAHRRDLGRDAGHSIRRPPIGSDWVVGSLSERDADPVSTRE